MVELKDITVAFSDTIACQNVSLHIQKKDIFGIVGFSGAGKSTLVRCINLLQRPDYGEVRIAGQDIMKLNEKELRKKRRKISMIFQHFNLFESRSILENVIYPIRKDKISKKEKHKKALELLKLVGIKDKKDSYPSELSGGEKQRCAIARALCSNPDILLCDEATSALDPTSTQKILTLLRELNEKLDLTIVIITHEMEVVKEICNKCAVMDKGEIVEQASTIDLFSNPQQDITKEFVKKANRFWENLERLQAKNLAIDKKEILAELKYFGESTTEPFIIELYKKWEIETNILFGDIDFISGVPVGNLIVTFSGKTQNLDKVLESLEDKSITINVLGGIDGILF